MDIEGELLQHLAVAEMDLEHVDVLDHVLQSQGQKRKGPGKGMLNHHRQ
jgi:hypothetical protein